MQDFVHQQYQASCFSFQISILRVLDANVQDPYTATADAQWKYVGAGNGAYDSAAWRWWHLGEPCAPPPPKKILTMAGWKIHHESMSWCIPYRGIFQPAIRSLVSGSVLTYETWGSRVGTPISHMFFFYWGTGGSSINKFQYTVLDFKLKDRKGNSLTMLQKNPFCFSKCSVWQDVTQLFYTSLRFVAILAGWAQENQCLHSLTEWHVTNGFLTREFLGVHFQSQGLWQWSSLCCK